MMVLKSSVKKHLVLHFWGAGLGAREKNILGAGWLVWTGFPIPGIQKQFPRNTPETLGHPRDP